MELNDYKINDLKIYLNRMQKSVLDKMFFIDKVFEPFSTIVDFGCANGELIKALQSLFGEYRYIGYDINEEMIAAAKEQTTIAEYYSKWDEIKADFSDSLLNISSTLHEIYSYSNSDEIDEFWERVFKSGFKYIAIRDMMLSENEDSYINTAQLSAVKRDREYSDKLKDFEEIWGAISNQHDIVHYLLKYKYTQNWEREVRENYLGISLEQLHTLIPDDYEIVYESHFLLPYIKWQIQNDFGICMETPTHIKIILKRK